MKIYDSSIFGVKIIEPRVFSDNRGCFWESWNAKGFSECGISADFVQDNHSVSVGGTLRGLHFQIRKPQGKLIRAVAGEIFDVVVDLRRPSPTFGQWEGFRISSVNRRTLWVPPGFAHGFYVTSDFAEVIYKCTDFYDPSFERCILWNDPGLGIDWPMREGQPNPLLSEKDQKGTLFSNTECYEGNF